MDQVAKRLSELQQVTGESDVESRLRALLAECGAGDYRQGVQTGSGPADLVCHQFRVAIETKSRGEAGPTRSGARSGESQYEQISRYVEALQVGRLDLGTSRPWRGFLTDGDRWWGWEWHVADPVQVGCLAPLEHVQDIRPGNDADVFRQFVTEYLAPSERRGRPPPPEPLRPLFLPYLAELKAMLVNVESKPFFRTKLNLWRRTLRGSGLVGQGPVGQAHNFAEHTVLVVAARLIVLSTQTDSTLDDLPESVGDGFCAWLLDYPEGLKLLLKLADTVSRYDWSTADRDLLKGLYHDLIDREDRKEFGEYYTPDWLAERLIGRVLLSDPSHLDTAIRSATSALGLTVTPPPRKVPTPC